MKKLRAYFQLLRPLNLLQGSVAVLVSAALVDAFPPWKILVIGILIVWAYTGAGNAINDYFDYDIDRINRPGRPIPSGRVRRREALSLAIGLYVAGTVLAIPLLTLELTVILTLALLGLILYSPLFKRSPLWGNLVVSGILGLAFVFATSLFGDIRKGIPPALLAFGFNLIREIVKDIQDVEGDRAVGACTIPLRYGIRPARNLVMLITLLLIGLAPLPYWLGIYGRLYLVVLMIAVEFPLLFVLYSIYRDSSPRNCGRLSAILKADIFFGLLAIFLGSV